MANQRNTYQQVKNVSINRERLIEIAALKCLSKNDLRVLLLLFSQLNGYSEPATNCKDPLNYKKIDKKAMSKVLDMSTKDIKKSIKNLEYEYLIEKGSSDTIRNGYRFTF